MNTNTNTNINININIQFKVLVKRFSLIVFLDLQYYNEIIFYVSSVNTLGLLHLRILQYGSNIKLS